MLIEHLEVDLASGPGSRHNLAVGGTCQPVEARHHERIALPHIVQARAELTGTCRTAVRLLKEFVAVLQLRALDVHTLSDGTHPCIPTYAIVCISCLRMFERMCEKPIMRHELRHDQGEVSQGRRCEALGPRRRHTATYGRPDD